jgi:hypothetical protein
MYQHVSILYVLPCALFQKGNGEWCSDVTDQIMEHALYKKGYLYIKNLLEWGRECSFTPFLVMHRFIDVFSSYVHVLSEKALTLCITVYHKITEVDLMREILI